MGTSGETSNSIFKGTLEPIGQLRDASNGSLLCKDETQALFVYKPVAGERPLWDFPDDTLSGREVAAANLDVMLGWGLVPPTRWIPDGPAGPGMVQKWVDEVDELRPVNIFDSESVPAGWLSILEAVDHNGKPVTLAHEASESLMRMALFDAIVNNADRKAGHVLADAHGQIFAIDHGVCFNEEPKLRTVLWGWVDQPILQPHLANLVTLQQTLGDFHDQIDPFLSRAESHELRQRIGGLLKTKSFPQPSAQWPAIPWPVF
jgi:uncharacterized repeat protein (TIGR03843 family)